MDTGPLCRVGTSATNIKFLHDIITVTVNGITTKIVILLVKLIKIKCLLYIPALKYNLSSTQNYQNIQRARNS